MADIYHMLRYNHDKGSWHCTIGNCSAEFHDEDLEAAGYSHNHDHALHINETDMVERLEQMKEDEKSCLITTGEHKTFDGTDSTPRSAISSLTSSSGDE